METGRKHIWFTGKLFLIMVLMCSTIHAQIIDEVVEYRPAPGQYINATPGILSAAASVMSPEGGLVSLGAFGGYVIYHFTKPIENHSDNPYGVDFVIFGNSNIDFSEPGIVCVMKDANKNGVADDQWYELAGSDHFFSSSIKDYSIVYTDPGQEFNADVPWTDNLSQQGYVYANSFHSQSYYPGEAFQNNFYNKNCSFSGKLIHVNIDDSDAFYIKSLTRTFGYADNYPAGDMTSSVPDNPYTRVQEGMGGDAMDISWAIDDNSKYVDLDAIDFVKIYCAANDKAGPLGEISTEIKMLRDIEPDNSINGENSILVVEDIPKQITLDNFEFKAHYFNEGRLVPDANVLWTVLIGPAEIESYNVLKINGPGKIELKAEFNGRESIVKTEAVEFTSNGELSRNEFDVKIYPNPFRNEFVVNYPEYFDLVLMDSAGRIVFSKKHLCGEERINPSEITTGFYFLNLITEKGIKKIKLLKLN